MLPTAENDRKLSAAERTRLDELANKLQQDHPDLASIISVYLLCMSTGFRTIIRTVTEGNSSSPLLHGIDDPATPHMAVLRAEVIAAFTALRNSVYEFRDCLELACSDHVSNLVGDARDKIFPEVVPDPIIFDVMRGMQVHYHLPSEIFSTETEARTWGDDMILLVHLVNYVYMAYTVARPFTFDNVCYVPARNIDASKLTRALQSLYFAMLAKYSGEIAAAKEAVAKLSKSDFVNVPTVSLRGLFLATWKFDL